MGFGKDGKGAILHENRTETVATLAANTAKIVGTNLATTEDFRMLKTEVMATLTGVTSSEMINLWVGLAEGSLSLAEIEENFETEGPLSSHDPVGDAIGLRPVWFLGRSDPKIGYTEVAFVGEGGSPLLVAKPRWTFGETTSWNWFIYNAGAAPTTGAVFRVRAKDFGVWLH